MGYNIPARRRRLVQAIATTMCIPRLDTIIMSGSVMIAPMVRAGREYINIDYHVIFDFNLEKYVHHLKMEDRHHARIGHIGMVWVVG